MEGGQGDSRRATRVGLILSLFGMFMIRDGFRWFGPPKSLWTTVCTEVLYWTLGIGLVLLIRRGEGLSLRSVGIGASPAWKSVGWGVVMGILSFAVALPLAHQLNYGHSAKAVAFSEQPLWLVTAIVFRAGILEEFFFRGYAMERLLSLGGSRYTATLLPLVIFALGHYTGGWANIPIAFVLGGILGGFYLWRRDLIANMFAHTFVDFVANVLPKVLGGT